MANIFEINRVSNKITLGTTDTTISIASHTASRILALDASKNLEVVTIGASLNYTRPTLNTIQDIRTSASPTFQGLSQVYNNNSSLFSLVSNTDVGVNAAAGFQFTTDGGSAYFYRTSNAYGFGIANDLVFQNTASGDVVFFTSADALRVEWDLNIIMKGALKIAERATATGSTAAYGQDWVKNTVPCEKWWTDDTGTDMLIAPLAYGEISVVGNAVETAIASQNVYIQVTIFDTNGENFKTTPDHTNDHLTITKAGRYFVSCSITLNSVGGAGSTAEIEVKKNNGTSRVGSLHVDRTLSGGGTESGAITITGIANLAVDDTIEVWIKNETNTQNYVVEDITLSLIQIGGA